MYWVNPVESFILTILAVLIIVIFWGAIYAFFIAIFQLIFSKGDAEKVKKAANNIRYMILWVFLTIMLLFLFPILFRLFNVPWSETYTARNIFNKASEIITNFVNTTKLMRYDSDTVPGSFSNQSYEL